MTPDELRLHRELQYLRAAGASGVRRRRGRSLQARAHQRRYLQIRARKLDAAEKAKP